MKTSSGKIQISKLAESFLTFGLFLYFSFHLLHGDRGYFALQGLDDRLSEVTAQYEKAHAQRETLENRVRLLRPASLDLDMLDERARAVLGYGLPDERVIIN